MPIDAFLAEELGEGEDTSRMCDQIAPLPGNRAAILFMAADPDYVNILSYVYEVEDFDPARVRVLLELDDWLMSLTRPEASDLMALEATTYIWRYRGAAWERERVAKPDMRRVWSPGDGTAILVGSDGQSYRFDGAAWTELEPDRIRQLFDVHAAGHGPAPIYCCGADGTLQKLRGAGWQAIDVGRGDQLRGLYSEVAQDDGQGDIRLAGDNGVALILRNEEEVIVLDAPEDSVFFGVCKYAGAYYWGDQGFGVYREEDGALVPFFETEFAFDLRSDGEFLYVTGDDRAWRFRDDGTEKGAWLPLRMVWRDGAFILVRE